MKLAFVMDPISKISYKKDSTLAMMIEAQQSEHEIYYVEPNDLYFDIEIPSCITSSISVFSILHSSITASKENFPSWAAEKFDSEPKNFPIGVLFADVITISVIFKIS